jgi:2-methylcitrate dehydratase
MPKPLAERMAEYAVRLRYEDLPPAVIHEVKRRVIDSLGCALGAWDAEPCRIGRKIAMTLTAENGSTLLGTRHRAPPDWAAFVNGCMVRYFDYNDTYLSKEPAHPSDNIPAALAVAEACGAPGRELIAAIVIAYEVQCRLCDATSLRAIGWDHVTYGAFSTALASARLMQLDAERTRHAVNIAGVRAAALRQSRVGELSHWKGCAFADAARHGVFAAMLAHEGMTGPAPIFEGERGFERLVSGPLIPAGPFGEVPTPAGADCMICKTSIKCWPVEYHAQSAVDAALQLRREAANPAEIQSVLVESHDAAVDIIGSEPEKWFPATRETADHSLPYIVAAALVDGEMTDRQFAPKRLRDRKLLELVQKVKVDRHTELSAAYPGAVGNIVTVTRSDGRTFTRRVDHACGHAKNPMSDEGVEMKFRTLAEPRIGSSRAAEVLNWLWKLDEALNVNDLFALVEVAR